MRDASAQALSPVPSGTFSSDEALLESFLRGDERARQVFPKKWRRRLRLMALTHARELAGQGVYEPEDVVQEAYLALLRAPAGSFDPARGKPSAFMRLKVRNAVRVTRDRYRPAGTPTRAKRPIPNVGLQTIAERECDHNAIGYDQATESRVEQAELIEMALAHADPSTAAAMRAILTGEADNATEAAAAGGMSRFALNRRLRRVREMLVAAA